MKKFGIAVALLVLAGCSDKGADMDGDGKLSNEEVAAEMGADGAMASKPGEWEVTTAFSDITAPGLPPEMQGKMKEQMAKGSVIKTCLTEEQASNPGAEFLGGNKQDCSFSKFDRSGSKLTAEMSCKAQGGMTMKSAMEGTFEAESYAMTVSTKMEGSPMGAIEMKGSVTGKRIGDCPAG